jgi:hypothetical protein
MFKHSVSLHCSPHELLAVDSSLWPAVQVSHQLAVPQGAPAPANTSYGENVDVDDIGEPYCYPRERFSGAGDSAACAIPSTPTGLVSEGGLPELSCGSTVEKIHSALVVYCLMAFFFYRFVISPRNLKSSSRKSRRVGQHTQTRRAPASRGTFVLYNPAYFLSSGVT